MEVLLPLLECRPHDRVQNTFYSVLVFLSLDLFANINTLLLRTLFCEIPDRNCIKYIEIVSHPGADRSITEEGLRTYRVFNRRYRNRRIDEFLKEMHLTEGRNIGFRKILNALERNGSPKPVFETDSERLSFSTTLFIHPHFLHQNESRNSIVNGRDGTVNDTVNGIVNEIPKLTKTERAAICHIENNNQATIDDIASAVGKSKSTVNRTIRNLKTKGFLSRSGSDKTGFWIVENKREGDR